MQESKQFKKNFIWNTLGTGLNAFNSLFFMIIATRVNGVDKYLLLLLLLHVYFMQLEYMQEEYIKLRN